uniref:Uncharacterized protein n=1 Tax=Salmonella enterica subsp. salamae TaxID=59202 RepID=I3W418_SALER|nr:hypothetical protein [Salmonella enterica subsp. salamae]
MVTIAIGCKSINYHISSDAMPVQPELFRDEIIITELPPEPLTG